MKAKFVIYILIILTIVATVAGCTKKKSDTGSTRTPSVTQEELEREVDWEKAENEGAIITSEDKDVVISASPQAAEMPSAAEIASQMVSETSLRSQLPPQKVWDATSMPDYVNGKFTLPDAVMMEDGSVGKIAIPKIGINVSVYETDNAIESLAKGLAHMKETSCWAGNVAIAGHNSGVNTYFADLHKLAEGDEITFSTALGIRTYNVQFKKEIDEMDWSELGRTENNMLTLITCVNYDATKRLCIRAVEKKA